ncbi:MULTISPECIES: chemotaxis protein CheC [Planktothricoides]|uniref:Chemotaxis protein CheC n=1 Tax=Planktothricoides raciborskii FACHB-1370 TaxID=2949576 RepID=A0ABR8EM18_9CYAN|nr:MULTISPECIES: chemotaxis protein CheC [Planktothricoides]KOR38589.1 chemotaxis protein CheC [Planktothricoides sp. SR001]MBD2547565.1 chemotaxis protein CheC [Planktothricoides raciborskii FACHB-1370]MBD2586042.1 chemotaxis protein CheC [Planktothricoides raciborskii FACHB-1261]
MNLTDSQLNTLQEVFNIGVGRSAGVLNEMIGLHICLQIPWVKIMSPLEAKKELADRLEGNPLSTVRLTFGGTLSGNAQLVFPTDSASQLVSILTEGELSSPDLDSMKIGALTEVGNIVLSGIMGAMSNLLKQDFEYLLPNYLEDSVDHLLEIQGYNANHTILLAQNSFNIEDMPIKGNIILLFKLGSFENLMAAISHLMDIDDE